MCGLDVDNRLRTQGVMGNSAKRRKLYSIPTPLGGVTLVPAKHPSSQGLEVVAVALVGRFRVVAIERIGV